MILVKGLAYEYKGLQPVRDVYKPCLCLLWEPASMEAHGHGHGGASD